MITVLGMWEADWMEAERTERRLWKQTIHAFDVDHWAMCGIHGNFSSPTQHEDLETMLAAHPGPKTFLIPPGRIESVDLSDYEHPEHGIYVFGNSARTMARCVTDSDDVVSLYTPKNAAMFGHAVLAAVLYDRLSKR